MRCKHPYLAKKRIGEVVEVGCGRCLYCRIQRRREWTLRLMHEAEHHKFKWFLTLTFKENPVTIRKRDLQLFMKRLRKQIKEPLKYYAVGEYGEQNERPHYHLILFGGSPEDLKVYRQWFGPKMKLRSEVLEKAWPYGWVDVGSVSEHSIRYVAGYVHKKLYGPDAYPEGIEPPFALMSKNLGVSYFLERIDEVKEAGGLFQRGKAVGFPRAYLKRIQKEIHKGNLEFGTILPIVDRKIQARKRLETRIHGKPKTKMNEEELLKAREYERKLGEQVDKHLKQHMKGKRRKL